MRLIVLPVSRLEYVLWWCSRHRPESVRIDVPDGSNVGPGDSVGERDQKDYKKAQTSHRTAVRHAVTASLV